MWWRRGRVELSLKHGLAVLVALNPEGDSVERILEAAEYCPVSAITVEDSEKGEKLFPPAGTLAAFAGWSILRANG